MAPLHPDLTRRILLPATQVLGLGDSTPTKRDDESIHTPSGTIAPYATGLNGVDQPMNMLFMRALWWTLGALSIFILLIRIGEIGWSHLRRISAMSTSDQWYWKTAQSRLTPIFKKHFTYAPLFNKRHTREMRLSAANALSFGTVPARLEVFFLIFYLVSNLIYTFRVDWSQDNKYALAAEVRGRAGTLALVNMVPLVLFATRNNPLIAVLKISFDLFNLVHRWMGRIVVLEIAIHTGAWCYVQVHVGEGGWQSIGGKIFHHVFEGSGALGALAMLILLILSFSPLRHAFYETFLTTHIILASLIIGMAWVHCASANVVGGLPQLPWVYAIVALWAFERLARLLRLAYCNWSIGRRDSNDSNSFTTAVIEALPCDATRVTLYLPKRMHIDPGTHAYLRFAGIRPWESHPFSIAWVEHRNHGPFLRSLGDGDGSSESLGEKQHQRPPPHQRQTSSSSSSSTTSPSSRPVTPDTGTGLLTRQQSLRAAVEYENSEEETITTAVSFLIGAQTGFTRQLYLHAKSSSSSSSSSKSPPPSSSYSSTTTFLHPNSSPSQQEQQQNPPPPTQNQNLVRLPAALEGPYAGHNALDSYGHAVLFAGSTGITHQLSYLQPLIRGFRTKSVATRRLKLVWVVRSVECLSWVKTPWLDEVFSSSEGRQLVEVDVYVTRGSLEFDGIDENEMMRDNVRIHKGRPDVQGILEGEVRGQIGAMAVTVCGPGGLADDVRLGVRRCQRLGTVVDFVEESFTW